MPEAPPEVAMWLGGAGLAIGLPLLVQRWAQRLADTEASRQRADEAWRTELRKDISSIKEATQALQVAQALHSQGIGQLTGRMDALERRQDLQSAAHQSAIRELRTEVRGGKG